MTPTYPHLTDSENSQMPTEKQAVDSTQATPTPDGKGAQRASLPTNVTDIGALTREANMGTDRTGRAWSKLVTEHDPWWQSFTEALCNSRGYQTNRQQMIASSKLMKGLKREMEAALYASLKM